MSTITVPTYHLGANAHSNRGDMAKRFPAPYSLTVVRNGWISRYTSDTPCVATAEAWLTHIQSQPEPPQSWCLLTPLENEKNVFFMWVDNGVVQEAIRCPIGGMNPVLLQRHTVFITDESLNAHLPTGGKGVFTPAFNVAVLSGFTLKKARQRPLIGIAIAAGALAVGAGLFYGLTPEPPPPPPIPVDPYATYRLTVSTAITAAPALNNMVALVAYSELLPQGWTVNTLTLEGAAIVLRVNRIQKGSNTGKHTTLIAWLAQHPALQDFATATFDTLTVSIPLTGTLSSWTNTAVPIEPMTTHALDSFLALGWTFTHRNGLGAVTQENTVTLTKAASLADIQQLANILAPLPAAMTDLSVTPSSVGVFTTTLTLTLLGTTP